MSPILLRSTGRAADPVWPSHGSDARVLLMSLAFLLTGGFLALHAVGTPGILFAGEHRAAASR